MKTFLQTNGDRALLRARSAGLRPAAGSHPENARVTSGNLFPMVLRLTEPRSYRLRRCRAMTLLDILVICVVLAVLVVILVPALYAPHTPRIQCLNNLKMVGLATRVWETDNMDKYPPFVPATNGGSMEYTTGTNVWRHFEVMSNELSTPKVLVCPADADRIEATSFTWLNNSNVSFFFGIDATETNPQMFLSGDRNLTNGTQVKNGIMVLTGAKPTSWTSEMHKKAGNIAFADGGAQQMNIARLRNAVTNTGFPTNRLQMPVLSP
jgi:prepilin-type processing-associated H-X9-DG protein